MCETDELKPRARNSLRGVLNDFARWRGHVDAMPHIELEETVLDESGYTAMWQNDKSPVAPGRLENLKELVRSMEEFENLQGFLEHVSLIMDNESDDQEEKVTLMTLHAAKGLEFDAVFLPGWEDGLFPHQRSVEDAGGRLEEERRLCYVGMTRATEMLYLTSSSSPSKFLSDIKPKYGHAGNAGSLDL